MNSARYAAPADADKEPAEVRLHPDDAAEHGVDDRAAVVVTSANGELRGTARIDASVRRGVVSCTHGVVDANVGSLTSARDGVDVETGMPQASGVVVTVAPALSPRTAQG